MQYLLHDDRLCGSNLERLSWTDSEVGEQCGLAITALAIEVFADQIGGFLVCREEDVMSPNVPDGEESVPTVPDSSAVKLEA